MNERVADLRLLASLAAEVDLQQVKVAAWIAPPRKGINGQPFDYDYVHLA